jgi:hypothetical protein
MNRQKKIEKTEKWLIDGVRAKCIQVKLQFNSMVTAWPLSSSSNPEIKKQMNKYRSIHLQLNLQFNY